MTGSRIFGPALAAVLVGAIGTAWCFLANGITFAAIIVSLLMIRTSEMFTVPPRPDAPGAVREGLRCDRSRREMALLFGVLVVVSMFAFNYSVSLPKLADERWGGEDNFGWVLAVMSIGSLTGSLLTARLRRVPMNWMLIMTWSARRVGHRHGLGAEPLARLRLVDPASASAGPASSRRNAISQQECPSDMRSRLMALRQWPSSGRPRSAGRSPVSSPTPSVPWSLAYGSMSPCSPWRGRSSSAGRERPAGGWG